MRRIALLLVGIIAVIAVQPSLAERELGPSETTPQIQMENTTDETRIAALEMKVSYLESMLMASQLPSPLAISTNRENGEILLSGTLLFWAGELPAERSFRLWCKQFDPSGFGNPSLIGLECGWTPVS